MQPPPDRAEAMIAYIDKFIMSTTLPLPLQHLQRYHSSDAERRLSERFGLYWDSQMQDWDLTNANADLLPAFFSLLTESSLPDDELHALMELTIASVDDELQRNPDNLEVWRTLETHLRHRPDLYASTMTYWAEPALLQYEEEQSFCISKQMASLWEELLPGLLADQGARRTHGYTANPT